MLIFTHAVPKERKVTIGPKLLQQFPKRFPQREIGLELLKSGVLQLEDGATQLLKLIRLRLGKDLQQDVSEHYKRFLHRSARLYQQSMQHYIAEESNLHERALQAVKSVSTPGKDEPETKEIIADVLRGFLQLENAALTGSEQVFVFGVAGESYAYNHIANALRETWGNDDRLRSRGIPLSQQLQGGHLAGGVHWTGEEDDWQETDHDYEDPLEPWTSEWYNIDGYDDESLLEGTDWTEDFCETDDYDPKDSTFSEHYPAHLDQTVETQEGDASKLETVQEAVAAANAAADMSRRTWTQARHLMKDVHRSRGYFPVSRGNMMEVDLGQGKSRGKKGRSSEGKGKRQAKSKGKGKGRRVSTHLARDTRTFHRFDKLAWKATSMVGSQVQVLLPVSVPSLQNFASFDLDGKFHSRFWSHNVHGRR